MTISPETFGGRIVAPLEASADLARFHIKFERQAASFEVLTETTANPKRGQIRLFHAGRTSEPLGGLDLVYLDDWILFLMDGRKAVALHEEAMNAVDAAIENYLVPGCSGRIRYTDGWNHLVDPDEDLVWAYALEFRTDYDRLAGHMHERSTEGGDVRITEGL